MTAGIIDGKVIASELRARVADEVARVRRDQGAALTALEEEAFEHVVIRRSAGYRRRGSQAALRGACAKVARRMGLP